MRVLPRSCSETRAPARLDSGATVHETGLALPLGPVRELRPAQLCALEA